MNYSKVTFNVPAQMISSDSIGEICPNINVNFLPMNGMNDQNQITDSSLESYKARLEPYNLQMMEWLQSPEHALSFFKDPLAAFQEAVDAPADLIDMLKGAQLNPVQVEQEEDVVSQIHQNLTENLTNQLADLTSGWDIVIGMRQDAINKALQYAYDKDLFPHSFSGEYESPVKGFDKVKLNATLSAPFMSYGTGSNITVALVVQDGTLELTMENPKLEPIKANIAGLTMKLTVNLEKVKSPVQPATGTRYDFMLDIASEDTFVGFELENVPAPFTPFTLIVELAILYILRFTFAGKQYKVFSADLKGLGEFEFVIPQEIDYAGQSDTEHLPAIGALIMTSDGHKGAVQLDAKLFPAQPEINAVMAMSRDLFLENLGISAFAKAFQIDSSYFAYNSDEHYVYATEEFNYYEKVKGHTVRIKSTKLKIENGELVIELCARVKPTAGIYIDYTVYAPNKASITEKEGKQAIHFEVDESNYREDHDVSAEWWVWLIAFIALVVGALILGIILAVMDAVAPDIGIDTFSSAIKDVEWNYINIVKMDTIELGDCIRLGCTAEFQPD